MAGIFIMKVSAILFFLGSLYTDNVVPISQAILTKEARHYSSLLISERFITT